MAKETISPAERHLEKGVLAICVLLFVGVLVKYLVSSPNTMLVGPREVGPAEIYQIVADEGKRLRDRIRDYRKDIPLPPTPELPPKSVSVSLLPAAVPYGPRVPKLETKESAPVGLVAVLPMGKPQVVIGRSGAVLSPSLPITAMPDNVDDYYTDWNVINGQDEPYVAAVNWVTVAATLDVKTQLERALKANYPPGRAVPYVIGADVERRERHWDGTYGEWEAKKPYASLTLPELPYLEVAEHDGKMQISDEQRDKIVRFAKTIRKEDYRLELMRPMPPRVAYGKYWLRDALERVLGVDLLRLDDEVLWGEEEGNCPLWDRYPKVPRPKDWKPPDLKNPKVRERVVNEELDKIEGWVEQGCYAAAKASLEDLKRTSTQYFNDKQLDRLEAMLERASALLKKKEMEAKKREEQNLPPPVREVSPIQVVWVHDALPESVASGKTYQYRMRALVYNNFAGAAGELKDPKDAEFVVLEGEWSPPSDDVSIPYDSEFYLVGKKERNQSAKVDVFKWHEGTWARASFYVTVGDVIGGKEFVKIGADRVNTRVDFSTGATVVDLNFNQPYRRRKERRGKITLDPPKPTVAMVYLDSAGKLYERLLDVDKRDERYKDMKEKVSRPTGPGPGGP